jgi:hypothetical protein
MENGNPNLQIRQRRFSREQEKLGYPAPDP